MLSSRVQPFSTTLLVRAGYGGGNRPQYGGDRNHEPPSFPPSPVVYVSNLPYQATPHDIKAAFGDFPGIQKITFGMLPDGRSKGFAHVTFSTQEEATALINAHDEAPFNFGEREATIAYGRNSAPRQDLPSRSSTRGHPPSPSLYIGSVPYTATGEDVQAAIGNIGKVSRVRIALDKDGNSKGFAHVDFESIEEAERVYEHTRTNPLVIQEREARVDRASPPTGVNPTSTRLYFKGFVGDAGELREALGEFGEQAIDLHLLKDPSGVLTGAGFLEFRTVQLATEAIKVFNGTALTPRSNFEITYAKARRERPQSSEGGERRGGFGLRGRGSDEGGYGNRERSYGRSSWEDRSRR